MRGGRAPFLLPVVAVAVSVSVTSLAACMDEPGDDARDTTAPTVEATTERVAGWFTDQSDPNGLDFAADEAECAARGVVDGLGVARIEELRSEADSEDTGSLDEGLDLLHEPPLDAGEADAVYDAMTGCIDFAGQVTELFVAAGKSQDTARCMAERYVETDVPRRAFMAAEADPELMADINAALVQVETTCNP